MRLTATMLIRRTYQSNNNKTATTTRAVCTPTFWWPDAWTACALFPLSASLGVSSLYPYTALSLYTLRQLHFMEPARVWSAPVQSGAHTTSCEQQQRCAYRPVRRCSFPSLLVFTPLLLFSSPSLLLHHVYRQLDYGEEMQRSPTARVAPHPESEGVPTRQHSDAPGRRTPFRHEEDHDSCPFTALRRSSWFLTLLQKQQPTSPLEITQVLSSFSFKNDFMFYPPPSTYYFEHTDDGSVIIKDDVLSDNSKYHRMSAPHRAVCGVAPLTSLTAPSVPADFEIIFVPLEFEVLAYHIQQAEVVVERRITVGGPLFFANFGCPIPCNVIRPQKGMSSHIALFFHCNGEDIGGSGNARLLTVANALHMTLLVPEYPGYGLFEGRPSEASIKGAMERVVQYLFTVDPSLTPSRVVLIGHSIGTGVTMHVAAYIQTLFDKYQCHYADTFICPEEITCSPSTNAEPFAAPDPVTDTASSVPRRCRHNYLGGIILLSPFAAVDCVESMRSFEKYGVTAKVMQYRQMLLQEDRLVSAPLQWADGCTEEEHTMAKQDSVDAWQPPLLFRFARCYSFNRFPTLDVACKLQDNYRFFSCTPLLLIHGSDDPVIGPFHSVAIASKLRESEDGRNARVFLSMLHGAGHNNMDCAGLIRRFYKDQILLPHVRRQEALQRRHQDAASLNASYAPTPRRGSAAPAPDDTRDAPSLGNSQLAPNLYFLQPGENVTVEMQEPNERRGLRGLMRRADETQLESPPIPPQLPNLSFTAQDAAVLQQFSDTAFGANASPPTPPPATNTLSRRNSEVPQQRAENASFILNNSIQVLQRQIQPAAEPLPSTATMVHMALQVNADHADVGSIMVAAMRQHAVPTERAFQLHRRHRRRAMVRRLLVASWFIILALFVLGIGIAHAVLASESQARRLVPTQDPTTFQRDSRVMAWYIVEALFNLIVAFLRGFHFRYALGRMSKYRGNSAVLEYVYGCFVILAWLMVLGTGVIMGMVLSLGQPGRGGVDWNRWQPYPQRQHMWVARVPRWAMLAFSVWHLVLVTFVFVKNH